MRPRIATFVNAKEGDYTWPPVGIFILYWQCTFWFLWLYRFDFFLVNIRVCKLSGSGAICDWWLLHWVVIQLAFWYYDVNLRLALLDIYVEAAIADVWASTIFYRRLMGLRRTRQMEARQIRTKRLRNRTGIIINKNIQINYQILMRINFITKKKLF